MVGQQHELIEQFLVLLKMSKGHSTSEPVKKALETPGLFHFGELIATPAIQQLRHSENEIVLRTIELFAYGTWADYKESPTDFMPLSEKQQKKLKQLTLCTLASRQKILPYKQLLEYIELENLRALEDFIIQECLYSGILKCKLDQENECLHVLSVIQRDVRPEELPMLTDRLEQMLNTIRTEGASLMNVVQHIASVHEDKAKFEEEFNCKLNKVKQTVAKTATFNRDPLRAEDGALVDLSSVPPSPGMPAGVHHVSSGYNKGPRAARVALPDAKRRR